MSFDLTIFKNTLGQASFLDDSGYKSTVNEKSFYIKLPAKEIYQKKLDESVLVQGVIDLYYINSDDELVLVDFKTDYVENRDEESLINKYRTQLELYKNALEQATKRKVSRMYIYSTYMEKEIEL